MTTSGLQYIMLGSTDVERSAAFYAERLGLAVQARFEGFAFVKAGETNIVLTADLGGRIADGAIFASELVFGVQSVRAAFEELRGAGVPFVNEPRAVNGNAWAVTCTDPDGHLISFYGDE